MNKEPKIIFFDGECGLCQRSIILLSNWDNKRILFFAPLNGETYKRYIKESSDMTTVMFYKNGEIFKKSDVIIEVARAIGGIKSVLIILKIIPQNFRDAFYNLIASNRKKVSCVILKKDERFLK
jgi:predicted DCC family thiol-disulfide oxidoreductase YuxK